MTTRFVMAVLISTCPFVLTPASNHCYQKRRIFKIFDIPNLFQALYRKFMLYYNMIRVMGTLMKTYVIYDNILLN
jgi:hypothetical protein